MARVGRSGEGDELTMISARAKITKTDGTVDSHPITPKVIVSFERHFKMGLQAAFIDNQHMEHTFWLGWEAERAAGKVVKPFDGWLDDIASVELIDESGPLDATA